MFLIALVSNPLSYGIAKDIIFKMQAAKETLIGIEDLARGFVSIRAGLASGSVAATVIGTHKSK